MTGSHQHTADPACQGKDVARANKVVGAYIAVREGQCRIGALLGGDSRRQAVPVVHAHRECGGQRRIVARHHGFEVQTLRIIHRQRRAENPARVADHECDPLGRCFRCGHDEVAFVFAVVVIDDDDEFALPHGLDSVLHAVEHYCPVSHCTLDLH